MAATATRGDPRRVYDERIAARRTTAARQQRFQAIAGNARVIVVVLSGLLLWIVLATESVSGWWLLLPLVLFLGLSVWFARIVRLLRCSQRAIAFYERGVARIEDRWSGGGEPGLRFLNPEHPYAADLDLFGPGSLFELLCIARTGTGQETLANWLLAAASAEDVPARQAAVAELGPLLDLREDLALVAGTSSGVDLRGLVTWGEAEPVFRFRRRRPIGIALVLVTVATLVGLLTLTTGVAPFAIAAILQLAFAAALRKRVHAVLLPIEKRARELALFAGILARFEAEQFMSPLLRRLREALDANGQPPSYRMAELGGLIDLLNARRNLFFAPLTPILLWSTHSAFAIEAWRRRSGPAIGRWLHTVGELEALCALAAYHFEHPADPFPEIIAGGAQVDGEGLGHPLLPATRCVRNDVHLGDDVRLLVVSGSNMSGKSTLLRTLGVNVVLALAGAPVRAHRLRLSLLRLGATLRIQDSLQAGKSRFYAEITRIRQLVDLANGAPPLLFLLDELLHGTNSHDRRLGASAIVRDLVQRGAIGLITTHDLALADIVAELGGKAANVHFEDTFENGAIAFDYRMRPGVVQKSNALALMRAVGIEV